MNKIVNPIAFHLFHQVNYDVLYVIFQVLFKYTFNDSIGLDLQKSIKHNTEILYTPHAVSLLLTSFITVAHLSRLRNQRW